MHLGHFLGYGQVLAQGEVQAIIMALLSLFVGFYVVSRVNPSFHAPLMGLTNAISSIVVFIPFSTMDMLQGFGKGMHWINQAAIFLLAVNIFGGLMVTWRMITMFYGKK